MCEAMKRIKLIVKNIEIMLCGFACDYYAKLMKYTKQNLKHKFLQILENIPNPPEVLYGYGKLPNKYQKVVAIVGSRHCTSYGEELAYKIAYDLARKGVVIVSGMAYGIDAAAHRGCL